MTESKPEYIMFRIQNIDILPKYDTVLYVQMLIISKDNYPSKKKDECTSATNLMQTAVESKGL